MSSYRTGHVDRTTAERLLAGRPRTAETTALTAVLRAASAPANSAELVREGVAVTAFRYAAQLDPIPEPRRPSMLKTAVAKILTVKAAIVIAGVGAAGVAFAAGSGALPGPWADTPATPPSTSRAADHTAPPSVTPTGRPSDPGKPADAGAGAHPDPSLTGLCQAYEAEVHENPGKALESPAFTELITAAGGPEKVPTYCTDLTREHPTGKPSDLPTPTESTHGQAPSTRPTPSSRPEAPASRTSGAEPPTGAEPPSHG